MTKATVCFEFEIEVEGTVERARVVPRGDPPEPATVEDVVISDVGIVNANPEWIAAEKARLTSGNRFPLWITHSLLTGVDTSNPEVQKLLGNLLSLIEDDAAEALFAADDASRP